MRQGLKILGIVLVLWGVGIQVHALIDAWQERNAPAAAVSHQPSVHDSMPGMEMPEPEKPLPMWRLLLTGTLLAAAAALALVAVPRGLRWGVPVLAVVWLALILPRVITDHRCWVAYDPARHGCHLFMRSVVLGTIGIALCAATSNNKR